MNVFEDHHGSLTQLNNRRFSTQLSSASSSGNVPRVPGTSARRPSTQSTFSTHFIDPMQVPPPLPPSSRQQQQQQYPNALSTSEFDGTDLEPISISFQHYAGTGSDMAQSNAPRAGSVPSPPPSPSPQSSPYASTSRHRNEVANFLRMFNPLHSNSLKRERNGKHENQNTQHNNNNNSNNSNEHDKSQNPHQQQHQTLLAPPNKTENQDNKKHFCKCRKKAKGLRPTLHLIMLLVTVVSLVSLAMSIILLCIQLNGNTPPQLAVPQVTDQNQTAAPISGGLWGNRVGNQFSSQVMIEKDPNASDTPQLLKIKKQSHYSLPGLILAYNGFVTPFNGTFYVYFSIALRRDAKLSNPKNQTFVALLKSRQKGYPQVKDRSLLRTEHTWRKKEDTEIERVTLHNGGLFYIMKGELLFVSVNQGNFVGSDSFMGMYLV